MPIICKRGGVSIYFKEHVAARPVLSPNLNECLVLGFLKKGYVISLYQSPSQSKNEFDNFLLNFEQLISDWISQNPHFRLETGDFNVLLSSCWKDDLKKDDLLLLSAMA